MVKFVMPGTRQDNPRDDDGARYRLAIGWMENG
jgi:hypothetical protein